MGLVLCELCGRMSSEGFRVSVLGSTVTACASCASLGKVVGPAVVREKPKKPVVSAGGPPKLSDEDWGLVDDYGGVVRRARERLGLKQEELAKKINEPESLLHRVETGHKRPEPELAKKLERVLKVRLLMEEGGGVFEAGDVKEGGVTLGDVVVVKKRGGG